MSAVSPQRIKELFDAAFDLAPDERERSLTKACAGDFRLFTEVQKLFATNDEESEFLEVPPALIQLSELSSASNPEVATGRRIGAYQIIREIRRGSMGAVFLAHRVDEAFHKQMAVKLVWPGIGSDEIVQRFRQERQILARLEHPNITRLLDGGTTADGWHYVVLEYVAGTPVTTYCEQQKLSQPARLELFRTICHAVQYAHQNLVIHRDIKPGNILVTADGTTKLLDFGIAKLLAPDEASLALTTTQFPLTPEYASPEQLRNEPVTTATDIYSLGIVLYELLTGRKPYRFKSPLLPEVARVVCEEEPEKPQLGGDCDNILLMALRKDPAQRYQSVAQFSADIHRYLSGEMILAHKPAFSYRVNKFIRRNRVAVALTALLLLTSLTFLGLALRQAIVATRETRLQRRQLYAAQMRQTGQDWQEGNLAQARATLRAYLPQNGTEGLRNFEWYYLWRLLPDDLFTITGKSTISTVSIAPDGKLIAVGAADGSITLCAAETGQAIASFGQHPAGIRRMEFSRDGKRLVTGNNGGLVKVWDVAERKEILTIQAHENKAVFAVTFSPDGQMVASASDDNTAKLWSATTGARIQTLKGHTEWVRSVRFLYDGKTILTSSNNQTVRLWNVATGKQQTVLTGYGNEVLSLALTPDEKYLVVGGLEREVKLFDLTTKKIIRTFTGHTDWAWAVALSPDGKIVVATGPDRTARLWETATGRALATIKAHDYETSLVEFTPDGQRLLTGDDKELKVWDVQQLLRPNIFHSAGQCTIEKIAFSPDGKFLMAGERKQAKQCQPNPHLIVWDIETGQQKFLSTEPSSFSSLAFVPHSNLLAAANLNGVARLRDIETGEKKLEFLGQAGPLYQNIGANTEEIQSLAVAPDGQIIATGDIRQTIKLWTSEGKEHLTIRGPGQLSHKRFYPVYAIDFSHDGKNLAVGGGGAAVDIFAATTGQKLFSLAPHGADVRAARFSPNDRLLATASEDHLVRIWDVSTRQVRFALNGHADVVYDVAWTPDGKRLATASKDKTIRLWNVETGLEVLTFRAHTDQVRSVAFSPDGRILASGSWDGTVRLWRTTNAQPFGGAISLSTNPK